MTTIPLTNSKVTIIDNCDRDLAQFKWHYHKTSRNKGYAVRNAPCQNRQKHAGWIYLHKVIAARKGLTSEIDHRNRNQLDNRRRNLRPAQHGHNIANSGLRVNNTSKFKGVSWRKDRCKWRAYIVVNYKQKHLGHFASKTRAAKAYNRAALRYFGAFAVLNAV